MLTIAALLSPEAYGIVTLSTVIFTVVLIFNEFGIWQAVVYRSAPDEQYLGTAFTANILIGFIMTIVLFLIAPWISSAFGAPGMTSVLRIMGLSLVLWAAIYVPDGLLRKELKFKDRVAPEVAGIFTATATTIALLLSGVGIASYAAGFVTEAIVRCLLTFRQAIRKVHWRPKLMLSLVCLREIFSYARHVFGTESIKYVSSNIDFFVVGRVLGAGPLGFYALAFNLANYPVTNFALILSKIAFPVFASLQEDLVYARRVYLRMTQTLTAVALPALVVLALVAGPLIVQVLGERWQSAVFPLQAMAVAGISRAVSVPSSDMLRGIGLPDVPFKVGLVEGGVLLVVLLLIAHWGIAAVALAVATIMSLASWFITGFTCRTLGIGGRELGRTLVPGFALATSGAGAVLSLELLDLSFLPSAVELIVLLVAPAAAMALCLTTVCRTFFREIIAFVSSAMKSK
jgi:PST family polysaccharide transporter